MHRATIIIGVTTVAAILIVGVIALSVAFSNQPSSRPSTPSDGITIVHAVNNSFDLSQLLPASGLATAFVGLCGPTVQDQGSLPNGFTANMTGTMVASATWEYINLGVTFVGPYGEFGSSSGELQGGTTHYEFSAPLGGTFTVTLDNCNQVGSPVPQYISLWLNYTAI